MASILSFSRKKVDTNPKKIEELLSRSIEQVLPSKKAFAELLASGKRLKIYTGADPTGPDLHIGHATNFIFLEKLRKLGHEIVVLFGDFTALIGDPSEKEAARRRLSKREVEKNIATWEQQVGKVMSLNNLDNPVRFEYNSAWLSRLSFAELLDLTSLVTVQQMLERDMFKRRIKKENPIFLHEFLYPVMQGYDSVALNVDVEVGGRDQLFNMLVGRDLQKSYNKKEKFVVSTILLEDPTTGKKLMNKSTGSYIALSSPPAEMYGKAMSLPDEVIIPVLMHSTNASQDEIQRIERLVASKKARDAKMAMARILVETYHDANAASSAEEEFVSVFQKKRIPGTMEEISARKGELLSAALVSSGVMSSGSEFRRLVNQGAVRNLDENKLIDNLRQKIEGTLRLKIGKKKFVRIVVGS